MRFSAGRHKGVCLRWVGWLLILLLPCLAVGVAQRQTLGPLHQHQPPRAHQNPHQDPHRAAAPESVQAHEHSHSQWLRHHHHFTADDVAPVTWGDAGDDASGGGAPAVLLLPVFGGPARRLAQAGAAGRDRDWPPSGAAAFDSRGTRPPLRPPRG